jgi:ABC-type glycerol-3-phosphate transport system permease component
VVAFLALLGALFLMLFPVFWMISTSFKIPSDALELPPSWIPQPFTLQNYAKSRTIATTRSTSGSTDTSTELKRRDDRFYHWMTSIKPVGEEKVDASLSQYG